MKFPVYVQPIRQMFLHRQSPDMVLRASLWQKEGQVWDDAKLSEGLKKSCYVAGIPVLNVSTGRQVTVAIETKHFSNELYLSGVDRLGPSIDAEALEDDVSSMETQRNYPRMIAKRVLRKP